MGCVYRLKDAHCRDCGGRATKRCKAEGHAVETRTRPTWWIKYSVNGRPEYESSGSAKKSDAERLLKKREGAAADGVPVSARVGRLRYEEALANLQTNRRNNGKDDAVSAHLTAYFSRRKMAEITTDDVEGYTASRLKAGAAKATINRELATLKRMFTLALRAKRLLYAPYIPMLDESGNVRRGFFERSQFDAVLAHLPERLRGIAVLCYWTGMRRGEVVGHRRKNSEGRVFRDVAPIQWKNVDRKHREIRLDAGSTKSGEGRTIPYGDVPELVAAIETQWAAHERLAAEGVISPWVFPKQRGKRPGDATGSFRKAWVAACKAAGCPGAKVHDFRRTAVRNLTRAGVTDTVAMTITGHRTASVFRRYNISSDADRRAAMRRVAEANG